MEIAAKEIAADNRTVVTWSLAAGVASLIHNLSEWSDMQARHSRVVEQTLRRRHTPSGPRYD